MSDIVDFSILCCSTIASTAAFACSNWVFDSLSFFSKRLALSDF
uniref:Uncharacterized protein n=1 Tax=Arundo donax TaxID=35708 RepID=A0A0A9DU25_ARUDO